FDTLFVASINFFTGFIKLLAKAMIIRVKTDAKAMSININIIRSQKSLNLSSLTIFSFVPRVKPILTINIVI
ncbi:MAG TPA: hypothetical protein DDY58_11935, partial [Terrisporobacter glycolicus]|nr:hypothetical protein [Terrisporobacter hibernicus]